jgi:hypothetical protein
MKKYVQLLLSLIAIFFIVPSTLALTVGVSSCGNSSETATFYSYNQADWLRLVAYDRQDRPPGTSGSLSCDGSDYCWIACYVKGSGITIFKIASGAKVYKGQTLYCYVPSRTATASTTKSDVCKS